jgi:hypothetical protein
MSCDQIVNRYCVRRGERDPKRIRVRIDATGIAVDDRVLPSFAAATSASLTMRNVATNVEETWTTTIAEQSEDLLVVDRLLQLSDTATVRTLHGTIWVTATGAANPVRCGAFLLMVLE